MIRKKREKTLYKPFPYKGSAKKKYSVYVKGPSGNPKLIHFGQLPYPHFKDKIGKHSRLDTNDPDRKRRYYARHGRTNDKNTAGYWAAKILW